MEKLFIILLMSLILLFGVKLNAQEMTNSISGHPIKTVNKHNFPAQNKSGNITYIDIGISQPNVEDCFEVFISDKYIEKELIKIYPNPNPGIFTLEINSQNYGKSLNISIYNLVGQKIHKYTETCFSSGYSKELDLSFLNSGTYFIRVQSKDNTDFTQIKKIMIK